MSWIKKVERVAIAVHDLERARNFFQDVLGARFEAIEDVKDMKFRYQPFTLGRFKMELLSPYDSSSVIARFLAKRGEGVHHLSLEVEDLEAAIAELQRRGVEIAYRHRYGADVHFEGFHWDEAFVHPKNAFGVLIHLAQKRPVAARKTRPRRKLGDPARAKARQAKSGRRRRGQRTRSKR